MTEGIYLMLKTPERDIEQVTEEHSILKLALAVITSPKDAFEEILSRQLLMPGIVISILTGLLLAGTVFYNFYYLKQSSMFTLAGASNPAGAVGMILINAFIVSQVAKFLQGEGDYIRTLTVLAWADCVMIPVILIGLFKPLGMLGIFGYLWALIVTIIGIQQAQRVTIWKSTGYFFIAMVVNSMLLMSIGKYYLGSLYPTIATEIFSQASNTIPSQIILGCLVTAALIVAAKKLPKLAEGTGYQNSVIIALAVIGLAGVITTSLLLHKEDPVWEVVRGVRAYQSEENPQPAKAVKHFQKELSYFPGDIYVKLYLAHALFASGNSDKALVQYNGFEAVKIYPPQVSILAWTGSGSAHYMEGNYDEARKDFNKSIKLYPKYPEPSARLALVYLRLGKTDDAVKAAKKAVDDGYKGPLPYVALAQAHTLSENTKEADDAISKVKEIDESLADKISSGPGGWSIAIERLTPLDLRMPLKLPQDKVRKGTGDGG